MSRLNKLAYEDAGDGGIVVRQSVMLCAHEIGHGWAAYKTRQCDAFSIGATSTHGWVSFEGVAFGDMAPMAIMVTAMAGPMVSHILGNGPLPPDITGGALFRLATRHPSANHEGVMDGDVRLLGDRELVLAAITLLRANGEAEDHIMMAIAGATNLAVQFAEATAYYVLSNYAFFEVLALRLDALGDEPDPLTGGQHCVRFEGEALERAMAASNTDKPVRVPAQKALLVADRSHRKLGTWHGPLPPEMQRPEA